MSKVKVWDIADIDGNVDANKLVEELTKGGLTLYGLDMEAIRCLRHAYLTLGGRLPVTAKDIEALSLRPEGREQEWVACSERLPDHDVMCFITDGEEIALALAERKHWEPGIWWEVMGMTGMERELNFTPTHWQPLTISLPQQSPQSQPREG